MKTTSTSRKWTGHVIGVILGTLAVLMPSEIYGAVWWFIPKTFWPIFATATLGGVIYLIIQVTWGISTVIWLLRRGMQ